MGITSDRDDPELSIIDPENGMQMSYLVLGEEERTPQKYVQPVRTSYTHLACGGITTMNLAIAQTYARDPAYYSGTYCARCMGHYPVGPNGEFVWLGTDIKVGSTPPLDSFDFVG